MPPVRRLTAILAADVAGYSRLMGADEEGTHERLQAHLRELVNPKVAEHRGRVVKNTGDGFIAEFASVVDAVRCAVEIQRGMIDRESEVPEERRIWFRMGVNLGDVIAEEHDIFGDGVNVAARLEALAEPGGICVSRVVRDQVRDKVAFAFEDRGEQSVKNIARPVRVYALRPEGITGVPTGRRSSGTWSTPHPVAPRLSIVVLPFTNLSDDPEQQYFADGITEDLTTDLSRIAGMLVISRNTAFTYRNKPVDTRQIGREQIEPSRLGVDWANSLVIAVQSPVRLSYFLHVGENLSFAHCPDDSLTGVLRSHLPQVLSERRCLMIESSARLRDIGILYRSALFPLSDDGIVIDHVLGAANYRPLRENESLVAPLVRTKWL